MPRAKWNLLLAFCGICIAIGFTRVFITHQEITSFALTLPVLVVTIMTLRISTPKGAKIEVIHLVSEKLTDLIFFILPKSDENGGKGQPVQYLLQLQVVLTNVGDRKAIISDIEINGFLNSDGQVIHLPGAQDSIGGMRWQQQSGWINGARHFQNLTDPPPYVLDRDDAILVRFRTQRGIDWSTHWNIDSLQRFIKDLQLPITGAFGTINWIKAGKTNSQSFCVDMKVEQQEEYVQLIRLHTEDFTRMPTLPPKTLLIE